MNAFFAGRRKTILRRLALPLLVLSAQGCTTTSAIVAPELNCSELNKVIAAASDNFSAIIDAKSDTRYGTIWKTTTHAYGQGCTLVGTGTLPGQYFCSIPATAQADAATRLETAVAACLGNAWQRTALPRGSRFTRATGDVIVDVGVNDAEAARAAATGLLVRAPKR